MGYIADYLQSFHPVIQTLFDIGFAWGMAALEAALIFMNRELNAKLLDWMLGFAAGAMIFVVVEDIIVAFG